MVFPGDELNLHIFEPCYRELLDVKKKFSQATDPLLSYEVAHDAGLSRAQEYELLGLFDERERLGYLRRHLKRVLPVVAEMESLKNPTQRSFQIPAGV